MSQEMSQGPLEGPLEMYAIKFPANQFRGQIAPALAELAQSGAVRIVDIYFIMRREDGSLEIEGMGDLSEDEQAIFGPALTQTSMDDSSDIPEQELSEITPLIEEGEAAVALLVENMWAIRFAQTLANANATLLAAHGIPSGTRITTGNLTLEERIEASATILPPREPDSAWTNEPRFNQSMEEATRTEAELMGSQMAGALPEDSVRLGEEPLDMEIEEELNASGDKDSTGAIYG